MCSSGTCARINSKLVRIRSVRGAMNCATTSQEDKGFNSKLVRLEVSFLWMIQQIQVGSFNSKLVRLETEQGFHVYTDSQEFQFQTGAIRRRGNVSMPKIRDTLFQFQTGAIRRSNTNVKLTVEIVEFQFQTGAIRSVLGYDRVLLSKVLFQFQTGSIRRQS